MAAHRIYHWKHGWIPLDHYAAMKKAKGSETGARKALAKSHASGHAHHSVVGGTHHNGTHVRGLQPVAREHLPRASHVVAAFHPHTRNFSLLDQRGSRIGLSGDYDGKAVTASVPERVAGRIHERGYEVIAVRETPDGHRLLVTNAQGDLKLIRADGADLNMIDPPSPPKVAPKVAAATPTTPRVTKKVATPTGPTEPYGGHRESHTITMRPSHYPGRADRAVLRPVDTMFGAGDVVDGQLGQHILGNDLRVIDYARRVVTTVDSGGVIRKFKADGSNIDKPVMGKAPKAFQRKDIHGWEHTEPHLAVVDDGSVGGRINAAKIKRAYVKGNKRVLIEHTMTDAQTEAFLSDVEKVFEATKGETGHIAISIRVPTGDRHMRTAYGYVWKGDTTRVHINPKVADGSATPQIDHTGYKMPVLGQQGMTQARYTMTHELGHIVDNDRGHTFEKGAPGRGLLDKAEEVRFHRTQLQKGLSGYGRSQTVEGYAEAYVQHALQPGVNEAASAYARRYGWT